MKKEDKTNQPQLKEEDIKTFMTFGLMLFTWMIIDAKFLRPHFPLYAQLFDDKEHKPSAEPTVEHIYHAYDSKPLFGVSLPLFPARDLVKARDIWEAIVEAREQYN